MSERTERFPLFDSLRALAALSVLLLHGVDRAGALQHKLDGIPFLLVANLYVGVPIFFLISGFLLYRPFAKSAISAKPLPHVGHYAGRRILRIVPAYWAALTVMAVILHLGYVFSLRRIALFYGFGQIYSSHTTNQGIGPAWTLCVEMTFYAFLPAFAIAMRAFPGATVRARLRNQVIGLSVLFAVAIAWNVWALTKSDPNSTAGQPLLNVLPAYLDQFALGMGLAVLSVWLANTSRRPLVLSLIDRVPSSAWLAALILWLASIEVARDPGYSAMSSGAYLVKHVLFGFVAVGVLLPAIVGSPERGAVRRLLANPKLLWVGLVSYGVYLYHQPLDILLLRWHVRGAFLGSPLMTVAVRIGALLAISLAAAAFSYYILERPAMRLRRFFEPARELRESEIGAASVPAIADAVDPRASASAS